MCVSYFGNLFQVELHHDCSIYEVMVIHDLGHNIGFKTITIINANQ